MIPTCNSHISLPAVSTSGASARRLSVTAALLLALVTTPQLAADWPQFRGPTGEGHATVKHVPLSWSSSKNVIWKVPVEGEGWSSPVLYRGKLYFTSAVKLPSEAYALKANCHDAATGRELFAVEIFQQPADAPKIHRKNSHASPTPIADGDQLFVHFGHQGTACLSLDGKILWKNDELKYPPVHGNGGSPALLKDRLIFSCDGRSDPFVAALSRSDGSLLWKTPRETDASRKFSFSTPAAIEVDGKLQVISPGSNAVCSYDPQTGKELWRVRYDGYSVIPRPVFAHGLIYISTGYNTPSVLAIRPGGEGDVTDTHVAWTVKRAAPHTPSLLVVGQELYMVSDSGIASCVDALSGKMHWQKRLGGGYSASPVYAGGRIYLQSEAGETHVLAPGKEYQLLQENSLEQRTLASYAVAENRLFIRGERELFCIGDPGDL